MNAKKLILKKIWPSIVRYYYKIWPYIVRYRHKIWPCIVRYRYKKTENKLLKKTNLRILFLVRETSKWGLTSLYNELKSDKRFEPLIAVTIRRRFFQTQENKNRAIDNLINFFLTRNMIVVNAYDKENDAHFNLEKFNPDIIFYDEPWVNSQMNIQKTSKFALACYIPYGLMVANSNDKHYQLLFQKLLWRFFAPQHSIKKLYLQAVPGVDANKIVVSGYPKLDFFLTEPSNIDESKYWSQQPSGLLPSKRVIYAPHYSVAKDSPLQYGTFDWCGASILDFARNNPKIDWVFKPHPKLKYDLVEKGIMSQNEVDYYYQSWMELPNTKIYEEGDYFDIFTTSDALVTDCGSFLVEYLPTHNPILHLINPKSVGYNILGHTIAENLYKVYDFADLVYIINRIVVKEDDYKKNARLKALSCIEINENGAGNLIKNYLGGYFFKENISEKTDQEKCNS